jgi:hypothetical protein
MALPVLYDITGHSLLSEKYNKLKTPEEKSDQQVMAELLLGLRAPVYTATEAEQLKYAIARQINFQLERGITPDVMKSLSNSHPGNTTQYRDRYADSGALAIVNRVCKIAVVGFSATGPGV